MSISSIVVIISDASNVQQELGVHVWRSLLKSPLSSRIVVRVLALKHSVFLMQHRYPLAPWNASLGNGRCCVFLGRDVAAEPLHLSSHGHNCLNKDGSLHSHVHTGSWQCRHPSLTWRPITSPAHVSSPSSLSVMSGVLHHHAVGANV